MSERSYDRVELVTAGTAAASRAWQGGIGALYVSNTPSGTTAAFETLVDSLWVPVKDLSGTAITFTTGGAEMWNFALPTGRIRINGTVAGVTDIIALGV